jgi:hypothetical protein
MHTPGARRKKRSADKDSEIRTALLSFPCFGRVEFHEKTPNNGFHLKKPAAKKQEAPALTDG